MGKLRKEYRLAGKELKRRFHKWVMPKCELCGQKIIDLAESRTKKGKTYHNRCYKNRTRSH